MNEAHKVYICEKCGSKITEETYETYGGMCEDCYETEIAELGYEDADY